MDDLKFSFILPDGAGLGGVTNWTLQTAELLVNQQIPCTILEHINPNDKNPLNVAEPIKHIPCKGPHPAHIISPQVKHFYPEPYEQLKDTVCIPNWSPGTYAGCALLSGKEKINLIGYVHTDYDYYYNLLSYYEPLISRFVAVSDDIELKLKAALPHRVDDIITRPYSVNIPSVNPKEEADSDRPLTLSYAGRFEEEQKRIMDFVPLVHALKKRFLPFTLNLIGAGECEAKLKEALRAIPLDANQFIHFPGRIDHHEMTEAWAETDISVLVSAFEGTSISMLESMGQGCVPVVTKVSGTSKVIQEGVNGFTAEVADLEGLADHIQRLHEDRTLLSRCSQAAFETVKQNYGHESYLAWLINMGEEIIAEEPRIWPKGRPIMQEAKGLKKYAVRAYKSLRQKAVKIKAGLST